MKGKCVYGPVPSRRLGRSLGVDLVPFKTCPYDCIYCQLGRSTNKTIDPGEYVPVDDALGDVAERLRAGPSPDFIGLAGSGEPTLHSRIGDIISGLKGLTGTPIAVLTNGSLLWRPEVRDGIAEADVVMPSLDAGDQATFQRVNRPHPDISFERMVEGLLAFSHGFEGKIYLEVFVLAGVTDGAEEIRRIAAIAEEMRPDRVQLNTVSRPPADSCALAVPTATLERLSRLFVGCCEVIAESRMDPRVDAPGGRDAEDEILELVSRRPCAVEGIAAGLAMHPNAVVKHLEALAMKGSVRAQRRGNVVFYQGVGNR
ncbi:MAG: radical SAM protein [Polyangiaceae bacterium]|nr:radical SAM protein [Polyangiaceae bacterium]